MTAAETASAPPRSASGWLIASGGFFFKYRNALFPAVILFVTLATRPRVLFGDPSLDRLLTQLGVVVAVLGELVRLSTIGFQYIERGGKNRQVWASRLVMGGVYGLCRNPMYVGNLLIVAGMCMIAGAPLAYAAVIPAFLYIYWVILLAEENFLRSKFGAEFERYCRAVPRWLPSFRGFPASFAGMRYDWKRALRQDASTVTGLCLGLVWLPLWRMLWLGGWAAIRPWLLTAAFQSAAVLAFFSFIIVLKKRRKIE